MILQGSQRGGSRDLAVHLLKEENEHVEVHELRGFVSDDLPGALDEIRAISQGTRAKQYLFSVSFNPPPGEKVTTAQFEAAINRVEKHFGLTDQPRAVVFHEKEGRRHAHAVWSRIDTGQMKAIPLPFTKRDLTEMSRDLFIEHGWKLPSGYIHKQERDPTNFTMEQWQQAKRTGKDPRQIKMALQDAWSLSDSRPAFENALKERGLFLARGDRRGFVVLDHHLEVYSLSKWLGVKTKDIKHKLGNPKGIQAVADTRKHVAAKMAEQLNSVKQERDQKLSTRRDLLLQEKQNLRLRHRRTREALHISHQYRQVQETLERNSRFRKGLRGIWDRMTGKHRNIREENEADYRACLERDRHEKDALIFKQLEQRRSLQTRLNRLEGYEKRTNDQLVRDIRQYQEIQSGERDAFDRHTIERERSGSKLER